VSYFRPQKAGKIGPRTIHSFSDSTSRLSQKAGQVNKDKVVITDCTLCRKHFGTVEQFKRHITEDVLPPLLDRLSSEAAVS